MANATIDIKNIVGMNRARRCRKNRIKIPYSKTLIVPRVHRTSESQSR